MDTALVNTETSCQTTIARQCTARSKRTHERCRRPAIIGGTVCYHHGGMTPRGPLAPTYKHGRYSKYMPAGPIADAYAAMHADRSQLHNLADDIAAVEGFRADALAGLLGADLTALAQSIADVAEALTRDDKPIAPQQAAEQLRQAATQANDANAAKRKAVAASHDKAKLIEVDLRRQAQQEKLVTREQAIAFGYAIIDACKAKLSPQDGQWLADQARRAAARFILGTDPDDTAQA